MATTEHFYAGTGTQTSFPFEFPYLTESDVFVALYNSSTGNFDIKQQNTSGQNNDYSISNTNIVFNTAPPQIAGVNNIHIYRNTDVETAKAVYNTGSAIRAQDLNNNTDQSLYKLQEGTQLINTDDIKDEAINSAKIKNETIVNADISSAAEIAVSKLADGSARQLLQTDAAGSGVEWASNIDIPGTLDVTGNTDIDGNLNVDGTVTAGGNVTTTGNLAVGGTLSVSDTTSLLNTNLVGTLDVSGGTKVDAIQIGVSGTNEINTSSGNLIIDSATGTTTVDDNLAVTGDLTVTGSITAPLWNGAALADFWLTSSQDIDHRGQTIQLAKVSNSNATHRFSVAKDYEFEVGKRVTEGVVLGAHYTGSLEPCFQVKHLINQERITKIGNSYSEYNGDEYGYINLGVGYYSGMTGNDTTTKNMQIRHSHLVFLGRKGFPQSGGDAQQNPNSDSTLTPTLVLSGQRGAMFTHPNNTTYMRTQGSTTYSGLGYLARGAYTQGVHASNDSYGWGNNGYASGAEAQALLEGAVDFQIIVGGARAKDRFEIGSSSVTGTLSLSGVDITANATQLNVLDGLTSNTSELNKLDGFTGSTTDLNEVVTGKNVVETITGSATDAQLPTAQAVNERIVELVTEVGGFHPIANETSFPTTNPDINDGAGTIVSVKALASNLTSNGSGVATIANGAGTGNTVTINGMANNDTIESGKGILLETTTTLHTYNFHREIVDSSGVATADALVSAFNERYYGPYSANQATRPSGANRVNGDLYFNTSDGKMKVFNGTHASGTWDDVAAPGNFFINTLSSSSGSGGGSATFNGTATRFTLSNPPLTAQQLLVSVNGVIQKPNSGTSPSEGFAIDGADIIFASAPATGAPHFIVTIGSSVNIGTPSNNTVGADQIIDGSISNAEISSSAAIAKSKLASLDIVNADVNASAAIAGTKISPDFGSQNIVTTGQVQLTGSYPLIKLYDSNNENDYSIRNNNGQFMIHDDDSGASVLNINSDGTTDVKGRLDAEAGLAVTGAITGTGDLTIDTDTLHVDSTNNRVGIGTSSPSTHLNIRGSTPRIQLEPTADAQTCRVQFTTTDGTVRSTIQSGGSLSSDIKFTRSTSESLRIDGSGNVGIGTTTPSTKFEVRDGSGTGISSRSTSTQATDGNKALKVRNNSDTDTFNVSYKGAGYFAGKVGIGTTSPAAPIHVVSDANNMMQLVSTDRYSTMYLIDNAGSTFIQCDSGVLRFGVGGGADSSGGESEAMRIGSTGLVGIGTNSPQNNLHIHGSTPAIRLSDSDNSSAYCLFDANGSNLNIHADKGNAVNNSTIGFGIDNSIKMTLLADGKLGIGTATPDQTVHIHKGSAGSASSDANSVLTLENSNHSILQMLSPAANSNRIMFGDPDDSNAGEINYDHSSDALIIKVNASERARIDSSGRLGIGTSTPDKPIEIRTETASHEILAINRAASGTAALYLGNDSSNNALISANNSVIKLGTDLNGTFTERFRVDTTGALLLDGKKLRFGNGSDLQLWHDGTHGYVANQEGNLYIRNNLGGDEGGDIHIEPKVGEKAISCLDDANVILYHNNVEKVRTTADGIAFNGDSAAANSLDDYEEGTWTPAVQSGASIDTSQNSAATYTKIGRLVHFNCYFYFGSSSSTATMSISGLPFTAATGNNYSYGTGRLKDADTIACQINTGATSLNIYKNGSTTMKYNEGSGDYILISGTYIAT